MSAEFRSFDLREMSFRESYGLLAAFVQPRPIAFVSTISSDGIPNLAPFSFFMVGGSNPPSVCFSPTLNSQGAEKDSLRNIRETGEFVINTVHREMVLGMNETSAPFPAHVSEWEHSGFTQVPSDLVRPARVSESYAQFECRLFQIIEHGNGPSASRYVIGEVLKIHTHDNLWLDGKLDGMGVPAIGRLGGEGYVDTGSVERFVLTRPS